MQSPPIHRSESQETEDQQHLTRLARTQSRVDRLQQRAPSPLRIPHSSHNTASPTTPAAAMQPHLAPTSTTSTDTQAHVQPDAQRNQEGYIIPRPMSVPSRASTPTPPLPKRPDRVQSLCLGSLSDRANWRISSATLLEISVLDDLDDNYKNNNEGRTGALRDVEAVAEYLRSDNDKEYRQRGGSPVSESKSSQQQNGPPSPHLLQGPEAAYQQQLTRHTRQEQMLKRSSQVIPVHHKHQNQRQLKHNNRVPSQSTIGPEHQHTKERPESKVLTEEEIAKLEMLFQKKKVLHERFDDIGASSSTDDLLSSTARYSGYGCGDGERALSAKKSWMDRPSGPIPLGFMVGLICAFTLVYNGVLSALVFQASRFPDDTNLLVFILSIIFIFTTVLSLFGFLVSWKLSRSASSARTTFSRAPQVLFKTFHLLFLLTTLLTCGGMLGWLGLNKFQTGAWDRMYLRASATATSTAAALRFESLLDRDATSPDLWIINPWGWIVAFMGVCLIQIYFWICLVAFGRRTRTEIARERREMEQTHRNDLKQWY